MELSKTVDGLPSLYMSVAVEENITEIKNYFGQNPNMSIRKVV